MTTFIAYANIQQPFSFDEILTDLVPENLRTEPQGNSRITQRHQCRRLAHFLLWQLLKTAGKSTALFIISTNMHVIVQNRHPFHQKVMVIYCVYPTLPAMEDRAKEYAPQTL